MIVNTIVLQRILGTQLFFYEKYTHHTEN